MWTFRGFWNPQKQAGFSTRYRNNLFNYSLEFLQFHLKIIQCIKSTYYFQVLPILVKYLGRNDVLKCRKICSQWKSTVDEYLEHLPYVSPDDAPASTKSLINWYFWPNTPAMITDFLQNNSSNTNNAFVLRRLRLGKDYNSVDDIDELAEYWTNVQLLLATFGSHVWCCKFSFEETSVSLIYILRGCLGRLPNIKSLDVSYADRGSCFGGSFRRYNDLIESLHETPFPALPCLEHLSVLNVPSIFFELVFSVYASSVKILEFCRAQLSHTAYSPGQPNGELPAMSQLETMYLFINREYFLTFPPSAPCLTKLTISCLQLVNGQALGKILNICKSTLKDLTVSLQFTEGSFETGSSFQELLSVKMPCLETIMLANPDQNWLKAFLENGCCPNIEIMMVKWSADNLTPEAALVEQSCNLRERTLRYSETNSRWIQIHSFVETTLCDQGLWKKLPELGTFHFKVVCKSSKRSIISTVITRRCMLGNRPEGNL